MTIHLGADVEAITVRDLFHRAVEMLEQRGVSARVYEDYSGRGMYGDTVDGIVTDGNSADIGWAIAVAALDLAMDRRGADMDGFDIREILEAAYDMLPTRSDSLGLDTIVY